MPFSLAIFALGLGVSGTILFGLFLFYAHAFAEEAAREGRNLPPAVAGLAKAPDQRSGADRPAATAPPP